jgi:putative SOS response-associated peptidase YedK
VADIHDRMPVILAQDDYARWLGDEPDPRDLMRPFPAGLMRMLPISTRSGGDGGRRSPEQSNEPICAALTFREEPLTRP